MAKFDMEADVKVLGAFDIQAIGSDGTINGNIIDTQGFYSITYVLQGGTITDGTFTPLVEEGDDSGLSDAAEVNDDYLRFIDANGDALSSGQEVAAAIDATGELSKLGVISNKRYSRLSIVATSVTTGGTLGSIVVLGKPAQAPVANNQ